MVVNNTTKKLRPLFPVDNSLSKSKVNNSLESKLHGSSTQKPKFENSSLKRNEQLLSSLKKIGKNL